MAEGTVNKKSCGLKRPTSFLQNRGHGIITSHSSDPYASINSTFVFPEKTHLAEIKWAINDKRG